ncbi:MAG: histone deacetylase [Candidatus Hydrogenedentota bacterium]
MNQSRARCACITDPVFLLHDNGYGHPERSERLRALGKAIEEQNLTRTLASLPIRDATREEILAVHAPSLVEWLEELHSEGGGQLDADTSMNAYSWTAAMRAAGAGCAAVEAIARGEIDRAFVAARPPGHHATSDTSMGFCLINNIAIAARRAQSLGLRRIFILDWDVHHGNGTQDIFYRDETVFFASLHQSPLYPGSGKTSDRGTGAGEGKTLNLPLHPGSGDEEFLQAVGRSLEAAAAFHPDLILVSAGYDAHVRDPLAQLEVTSAGFRKASIRAVEAANDLCGGRLVAFLEGGYDLVGLAESASATIAVMADAG